MRKILSILCIGLLTSLAPSAVAATKIVPGSACKKANEKITYKNVTYTCIKLGSKLYWNNGITAKKPKDSLNFPATCNVSVPQWGLIPNPEGTGGTVLLSALIVNSSISNVATNVRIFYEWYNAYGVTFRKTIEIPKIYPGVMPFGDIDYFEINGLNNRERPNDVTVRSSCSSSPITQSDLINGKFATVTGSAAIQTSVDNSVVGEGGSPVYYGKASFIFKNIFNKKLKLDYPGELKIFGVIKDKLGNTVGGYNGYISPELNEISVIYPEDSPRIDVEVLSAGITSNDSSLLNRFSVFEYVIIPDVS